MNALSYVGRKARALRKYSNLRGVLFFAQRKVLGAKSRRRLSRLVARFLPAANTASSPLSAAAVAMEREGFVHFDGILTPKMVEQMRTYLSAQPLYAPYLPTAPRVHIDANDLPDSHILGVPEDLLVRCPHLLDVANHPDILGAVEGIFGCKPTIGFISAWWSIPTHDGVPREAENFHRDFDDVAFAKLFIYLTDVGEKNGPHEFIRGSHDHSALRPIRRYTDEDVLEAFGADKLVRFTGNAGTIFLENTTGFHRGLVVKGGRRLILQIVYSMLPMAYGPAQPYGRTTFQPASVPVDPYTNRIYVGQS
jgi:hypothetical protein